MDEDLETQLTVDGDTPAETDDQRRSRKAAIIWLICFVGGTYLLATVVGLWLWISGRLNF
jgi:fatty acid desaturase